MLVGINQRVLLCHLTRMVDINIIAEVILATFGCQGYCSIWDFDLSLCQCFFLGKCEIQQDAR